MNLAERAQAVRTRDDLAAFVVELKADLDTNPDAWENGNLHSFLEAMAAWIGDMQGYYQNTGQSLSDLPPWKVFADILMGARLYE